VAPIFEKQNGALIGTTISFFDTTAYKRLEGDLHQANQELEVAYEELQSTNEELETTNEELQSTVEELETTNEELQSTNEELETMNEELQSTNEELETINEELQKRGEELNQVNAFLESILISLQTAVVVINREMRVHVWNPRAEEMWGLRSAEVQGEYFANLDFGLPIPALLPAIRACIAGDTPFHQETMEATNRRGRPIVCRIVSTPLQGEDGMTHGAILLMETVTQNEVESTQ
jgi:two-component system CheB/CheR fusion protein